MAYGTYSGAWLRETTNQGDVQHTLDPGHAVNTNPVGPAANFTETPPADDIAVFVDPSSLAQVVGSDWMYVDVPSAVPGIQQNGHAGGDQAVPDGSTSLIYNRPKPLQFSDEQYQVERWETPQFGPDGPVGADGFVTSSFRGINGLSENNPEGFRHGFDSNTNTYRKFNVGERSQHARVLPPNVIFNPTVIPADMQSPYGRVFASNTRWQSVEVPTAYAPVTPPANFDAGMVQQNPAPVSPVVGW